MDKELRDELLCQADWRRHKASEFPNDDRNERAALLFDQLAASVADCPDDLLKQTMAIMASDFDLISVWCECLRTVGIPLLSEERRRTLKDVHQLSRQGRCLIDPGIMTGIVI